MNHLPFDVVSGDARHLFTNATRAPEFVLRGPDGALSASGVAHALPRVKARELEERLRAFFAANAEARMVVGALPFDHEREVVCYAPERSVRGDGALATGRSGGGGWRPVRVVGEPDALAYGRKVQRALDRLGDPSHPLRKVVLARSLHVEGLTPIDVEAVAARLARDPSVTTFLVDLALGGERHRLVGATPELLVSRRGRRIVSHPLAGSAARAKDEAEDTRAGEALLRSEKDRREHGVVVEAILDVLAPYCSELSAPRGIGLRSTATMWHLGTRIEGTLRSNDAPSAAGLAALLHPTPAVGGDPRAEALAAIRELETHDRGFYAGALGWTDARGDGDWYVTLRCAEVRGTRLTLHAGAGIVAGSDPTREIAETSAKLRTMLLALGIDEQGSASGSGAS